MSSAEWAAWLVAVGTVGTFTTGGWLLVREVRRDRMRDVHDQAERVAGWALTDAASGEVEYTVHNGSDLPIYNAVVIMPEDNDGGRLANYDVGMVPAGDRTTINGGCGLASEYSRARPMAFAFTDRVGRRWLRDGLGLLYAGTRKNLDRLEYPWGIVGGEGAETYFSNLD